jgi:hypothetical protein
MAQPAMMATTTYMMRLRERSPDAMERAAAAPVAMLIARGACGLPEPCLMAPIRARGGPLLLLGASKPGIPTPGKRSNEDSLAVHGRNQTSTCGQATYKVILTKQSANRAGSCSAHMILTKVKLQIIYSVIKCSLLLGNIRCSLAGQDTRLSPERPGF